MTKFGQHPEKDVVDLASEASVSVLFANLLDMGNEIQELNGSYGDGSRAGLEQQIPRSVLFNFEIK